jgi:ubiquinone/menaquinone biosynthesis C-methylase UbiE
MLTRLLRCPRCGSELVLAADAACSGGHRFAIVDGVPVFLTDETIAHEPQHSGQRSYFDAEFQGLDRYTLENWRAAYVDRLDAAGLLDESAAPLLDIGVGGSGYTVIEAARGGVPAIGCDLSLEGLRRAHGFAAAEGVAERTLWVRCSAEKLPLASESFGAALAIAVLEHVPDEELALGELARVLRRGGRAWITVPHALRHVPAVFRGANRRHDRRLGHLRRYEAESLIDRARSVGLEPLDVQFTGHSVKVMQLLAGRFSDRLWWWCEARDRRRSNDRQGSMQLSVVFARA